MRGWCRGVFGVWVKPQLRSQRNTSLHGDRHKYIKEKLCESIWIIGGWYSLVNVCLLHVVLNNKIFSAFRTTSVHIHTHSLVGHNYNIVSRYKTYTPSTNHIRSWGWWWLHIWRSCRKDDRQRWVYLSVAHLPQQHTRTHTHHIRYFASNMWNERYILFKTSHQFHPFYQIECMFLVFSMCSPYLCIFSTQSVCVCVCVSYISTARCAGHDRGMEIILMSNICILFMAILLNVCFLISFSKMFDNITYCLCVCALHAF